MSEQKKTEDSYSFIQKVWITGGIVSLIVIILLLIKATFSVLLLVLAGALIAIYFTGLSGLIFRKTKWKRGICLTISVLGTVLLVAALFWLIGAKLETQLSELTDTLPKTIERAKEQLEKSDLGKSVVKRISSPESAQKLKASLGSFFKSTFGVLGDIYVVVFIAIFFTAAPGVYKRGIVDLIPQKGKQKAAEILDKLGENLKKWLKGKFFAMFVVFVLTAAGLAIIGIPLWLVLAIIAGLFNFIPNFGPLIGMVPAVLVALMIGPSAAAIVGALYILIQVVESNFITPLVQQKLVSIPPALIIIAQLLISPLTGGWGLVLATPLMLIVMILVKELYIKNQKT